MIVYYRGKDIDINSKLIEDYNKFNMWKFSTDDIDTYVYNKYIWDKSRENEIPSIAASLTKEDIENTVHEALLFIIRGYLCNPSYEVL